MTQAFIAAVNPRVTPMTIPSLNSLMKSRDSPPPAWEDAA